MFLFVTFSIYLDFYYSLRVMYNILNRKQIKTYSVIGVYPTRLINLLCFISNVSQIRLYYLVKRNRHYFLDIFYC